MNRTQLKRGRSRTLAPRWVGPYIVIRKISSVSFVVRRPHGRKDVTVHHDRLKPYVWRDERLRQTFRVPDVRAVEKTPQEEIDRESARNQEQSIYTNTETEANEEPAIDELNDDDARNNDGYTPDEDDDCEGTDDGYTPDEDEDSEDHPGQQDRILRPRNRLARPTWLSDYVAVTLLN
eukprot:m.253196 g.253196  ORF g.253196 m.253196 type:complete len:178 (+) comp40368_c2_seq9:6416-6949(+)